MMVDFQGPVEVSNGLRGSLPEVRDGEQIDVDVDEEEEEEEEMVGVPEEVQDFIIPHTCCQTGKTKGV